MSGMLQALFAVLAALSVPSGIPQNNPANFQAPIHSALSGINITQVLTPTVDPSVEITGTIQSVTSTQGVTGSITIVLDTGITVTLGITTEVNGNLKPGMTVQIEGTLLPDGSIAATEIKPGLGQGDDKSNGEDKGKGDDKEGSTTGITSTVTITNDDSLDGKVITGTVGTGDKDKGGGKGVQTGDDNKGSSPQGSVSNGPAKGGDGSGQQHVGEDDHQSNGGNGGQSNGGNVGNNSQPKGGEHGGGGD